MKLKYVQYLILCIIIFVANVYCFRSVGDFKFSAKLVLWSSLPFLAMMVFHGILSIKRCPSIYTLYATYIMQMVVFLFFTTGVFLDIQNGRPGSALLPIAFYTFSFALAAIGLIVYCVLYLIIPVSFRRYKNTTKILIDQNPVTKKSSSEHERRRVWFTVAPVVTVFCVVILGYFLLVRDFAGHKKYTDLITAAVYGHIDSIKKIIEEGADINMTDNDGDSPLHRACLSSREQAVSFLISHGATVNSRSNNGQSPLHYAAYAGNNKIVKLLIEAGADINMMSIHGQTPLNRAVHKGHASTVTLLLNEGAIPDQASSNCWPPLFIAIHYGYDDIVELLLSRGANPDMQDDEGRTPLSLAVSKKRIKAQVLLKQYIKESGKTKRGQTLRLRNTGIEAVECD
jgi:ankyrin repeat protein